MFFLLKSRKPEMQTVSFSFFHMSLLLRLTGTSSHFRHKCSRKNLCLLCFFPLHFSSFLSLSLFCVCFCANGFLGFFWSLVDVCSGFQFFLLHLLLLICLFVHFACSMVGFKECALICALVLWRAEFCFFFPSLLRQTRISRANIHHN